MWVYRPLLCDPPMCTLMDLQRITIDDVAQMHEVLDLRDALAHAESERQERAQRMAAAKRGIR